MRLVLAAMFALLAGCAAPPQIELGPDQPPRFEAVLEPRLGADGEVAAIHVESVIYGGLAPGEERLRLTMPVVYAGAYGIADRTHELVVRDAGGEVPMEVRDDPAAPGGLPYFRHWTAAREVRFPVRVSWNTRVEGHTGRNGPPFNIKPSAGGVSGAGSGFLVFPTNAAAQESRVRWNLGAFGPGAAGISTFGEGAFVREGPPSDLISGWYMAGPLGRYPEQGDAGGFSAAWLGQFPFDPAAEMALAGEAYAYLADAFGYLDPPPRYRVFMRIVDSLQTRFAGTALGNSFLLSGGRDSGRETHGAPPRATFFHEMIHMWVGQMEGGMGITSWFSEGLTSYYTLVLPFRGGYITAGEFIDGVNATAERYYTSPALNFSMEEIAEVGFSSEDIRAHPYSRGALYFADLDARIRAHSNGERSLDDFIGSLFRKREADPEFTFDRAAWVYALIVELGPEAAAGFTAHIQDGETLEMSADAFGPCFERAAAEYEGPEGSVAGYRWVFRGDGSNPDCLPAERTRR